MATICPAAILLGCSLAVSAAQAGEHPGEVFGEFVGSSPCGESIRPLLGIPRDAPTGLVEWKLTLLHDPDTREPAEYRLCCQYGPVRQGSPGLDLAQSRTFEKSGRWRRRSGSGWGPRGVAYELAGAVTLAEVHRNVLHLLDADRRLMVGTGGWSYTLNRVDAAEEPGDYARALAAPSVSYSLSPLATGPGTFGVFEGRTPARGISRVLGRPDDPARIKAKWRVTLHQNPATGTPTTYKLEGTLYSRGLRGGPWTILRGARSTPGATIYRLEPAAGEPALLLLKGDDNVLFFLDQDQQPLVGNAEFSYTLNRRDEAAEVE